MNTKYKIVSHEYGHIISYASTESEAVEISKKFNKGQTEDEADILLIYKK